MALQSFRDDVIGYHVTAMCDNSTVVAYVNKQGGMVSPGPLLVGQPPSEMDGESRHPSRCEVSSRTSQCPGRSPQPLLPKVRLFGKGCWGLVRVPQILHLTPLPVEVADLLWLVSWKGRCSSQRHCSSSRGLPNTPTPRQGLVRLCG